MPNFRRNWLGGGTYFFTVVTAGRSPWFLDDGAKQLLGDCFRAEMDARPFETFATVLLPDHLHAIWVLPRGDDDYSSRWASIKSRFTREWLATEHGNERPVTDAQRRERRRGVWQPRFMEHTIRDEDDLIRHVEFIHYNPVKHGLTSCPKDWRWSSFRRFVRMGDYPEDWACSGTGWVPKFDGLDADLIE
jgi:putative transposase